MEKYCVSVYSPKGEFTICFGPFNESELEEFDQKIWNDTDYDYESIQTFAINDPALFGTGMGIVS